MSTAIRSEATRSVVNVNGVDRVAVNADGSLELLTPASNPTGNKVPVASQLPFTKEYVSPPQTITNGGLITLSHGLGSTPKLVVLDLVCVTADRGHAVGTVLDGSAGPGTGGYNGQVQRFPAEIKIRVGSNGLVAFGDGAGTQVLLTNSSWRFVVRAWA